MCKRITNRQPIHPPTHEKPQWKHQRIRLRHEDWLGSESTSVKWLRERCYSYGCVLPIAICLSNSKLGCSNNRKSHNQHYDQTCLLTNGSLFRQAISIVSQGIKRVAENLGITLQHATTKHAQTIKMLERIHVSIEKALMIETGERRSMWHKYVNISVLNYNTSYLASIGCEPGRVFHGRIIYNVWDLEMGIRPQKTPTPKSQVLQDVIQQTKIIFQEVCKKTMRAHRTCKAYCDKKANASNLKKLHNVYVLQPKADHQGSKIPFTDFWRTCTSIVEKALTKIVFTWYANSERTKLKCFIAWDYAPSHLQNPIFDVQPGSREWKPDPESIIKKMISTPEHGSVNMKSLLLTTIKMKPTYLSPRN